MPNVIKMRDRKIQWVQLKQLQKYTFMTWSRKKTKFTQFDIRLKKLITDEGSVPGALYLPHSAAGWLWQTGWEPAESHSPAGPAATEWTQSGAGPMGAKRQQIKQLLYRHIHIVEMVCKGIINKYF